MIDNKLQFYQTRAGYDAQAEAGNIPNDALVFVKETHEIITHGEEDFGNSDKYGDIAYLGDQAGTAVTPEFNPQDDTVWTKDQILSDDKKDTVQANILNKVAGDGMGKVVLKRNMVSEVNTLTQDMFYKTEGNTRVPNTDTIFVIKYDFTLGEDITIPANCILEFDGGSISGEHTLNLNHSDIKGVGFIECQLNNLPDRYIELSTFVSDMSDSVKVTSALQRLVNLNACIIVDRDIVCNSQISIPDNHCLRLRGSKRFVKITFPSSKGFVWNTQNSYSQNNSVENLEIKSKGISFDFYNDGVGYSVYNSIFEHLVVESEDADCFYGAGGVKSMDGSLFNSTFNDIAVKATNGRGFVGLFYNTIQYLSIKDWGCNDYVFYNCSGYIRDFCGTFGTTHSVAFLGIATQVPLVFEHCNFEDYDSSLLYADNNGAMQVILIGNKLAPKNVSNLDFNLFQLNRIPSVSFVNNDIPYNLSFDADHAFVYTEYFGGYMLSAFSIPEATFKDYRGKFKVFGAENTFTPIV